MRASIIIILVLATGIIVTASRSHNYSHFVKHHAKPRVIRGYIPRQLSTSIGFGKRQSSADVLQINKQDRILSMFLQYFPRGIPADWMLRQVKANPAFATKLIELLMDGHGDLSGIDQSNPGRTTWLF